MTTDSVEALQRELACYKLKAEQLEYKVEEVSRLLICQGVKTKRLFYKGEEVRITYVFLEMKRLNETFIAKLLHV